MMMMVMMMHGLRGDVRRAAQRHRMSACGFFGFFPFRMCVCVANVE
jgi:hypothetical protein